MILLDTHVWVRWLAPFEQPLPASVVELLETADDVGVSVISCWEVVYLSRRNRLHLPLPIDEWLDEALQGSGIASIALTKAMAAKAAMLSDTHRDPADRFIVATALETQRSLLTLDETMRQYPELGGLLL